MSAPQTEALVFVAGQEIARHNLGPGANSFGASDECSIRIEAALVSPRHARLTVGDDGSLLAEDLGSANGTFLDGLRITAPTPVAPNQIIQIGIAQILILQNTVGASDESTVAAEYLASQNEGDLMILARQDFFHDCGDLYLGFDKTLLTLTEQGQLADKTILTVGLQQITYGADGFADKFFPKMGNVGQNTFVVDPAINYGRISIVRLGVGADAIAARFKAGEKVMDIAEDYGATPEEVVEAVVWHDRLAA